MMISKYLIAGVFGFTIATGYAQELPEYDRDIRIHTEPNLPGISEFMDACGFTARSKWYKEIGPDGIFFEGKTKLNGVAYSIEFDTLGTLKDLEKTVAFESLSSVVQQEIRQYLSGHFTRHRILKTQIQWSGDNAALIELVRRGASALPHVTQYELLVKGKQSSGRKNYELLFDQDGMLLKGSEVPPRNTDHLDF